MPRRGRGGKRTGRIGAPYSNRSDLQQPRADFTGQTYGEGVKQRARQQAVPVAAPSLPVAQSSPYVMRTPVPVPPGAVTPLDAPTQRPDEPLTTGLSVGPGAGPEVLTLGGPDDASTMLRRLYAAYPSEDLRALIEFNESVAIGNSGMRVNRYAQLDASQVQRSVTTPEEALQIQRHMERYSQDFGNREPVDSRDVRLSPQDALQRQRLMERQSYNRSYGNTGDEGA